MYMRKGIFCFAIFVMLVPIVANAAFTSCGPGYVLVEGRKKIDGVPLSECQKLWCRDLENGKIMGSEEKPNSGYQATSFATELCDAAGNCVECWGARKWCAGEARGEWNSEYARMSATELLQPQCTAAITPFSLSQSKAGTQSATKHIMGRLRSVVIMPSAS